MKQRPPVETILDLIQQNPGRLTASDILNAAASAGIHRNTARQCLKILVESGELVYRPDHGHIFVEISYGRPVRLSPHVIVTPEGVSAEPDPNIFVVTLRHGSSFGTGRHPSTRLAVRALDHLFFEHGFPGQFLESGLLDIGTGSGILAIAALRMGISHAVGLDIDACARFEAAENAAINRVQDRFRIWETPIENLSEKFSLITANLRVPSLSGIVSDIERLTVPGSFVVFSGLKSEEAMDLFQEYGSAGFECLWEKEEIGWAAGLLIKKG